MGQEVRDGSGGAQCEVVRQGVASNESEWMCVKGRRLGVGRGTSAPVLPPLSHPSHPFTPCTVLHPYTARVDRPRSRVLHLYTARPPQRYTSYQQLSCNPLSTPVPPL